LEGIGFLCAPYERFMSCREKNLWSHTTTMAGDGYSTMKNSLILDFTKSLFYPDRGGAFQMTVRDLPKNDATPGTATG